MKNTIFRILKYCRAYWGYFILTVICTLIGISLSLIVPVMIGKAVDSAVGVNQVDFDRLGKIVLKLGGMVLVSTGFQFLESLFINKLAFGTVKDLRSELTAKLEEMPVA
ncbi:MAG: ABC transporter ATP-binding protein, partial [Oscillospiraceae bacterium]|nr:ABC transporter ATP-binding protein [Oscillospiraceae bacterium]